MQNVAFTYFESTAVAARELEVPAADFAGGCNYGRNGLIGPCTAVYDFTAESFSYEHLDYVNDMYIGDDVATAAVPIRDFVVGGTSEFVIAPQDTAPLDGYITGLLNLTGETVPLGSRAFGFRSPV